MSTTIAKNFQVGNDATASNNFTILQPSTPDGTLRIANGNTGSGTNIATLTSAGNLTLAGNTFTLGSAALSPAVAGELEYDGKAFYLTPQGTQRGIVPGSQFFRLNSGLAGANVSTAQNVFGVGCTLSTSTVYAFQALYAFSKTSGATSHSFGIGFGGTATLNNIAYQLNGQYNGTGFNATTTTIGNLQVNFVQAATNFVLVTGVTTNAYLMFIVTGTVSVNAGGTFIPQYTLSAAPGGAYTTAAGAYFSIYPIGTAGSNTSVGTWA